MLSFVSTGLPTPSPAPFRLVDGGYMAYSPSERPQLNLLALCTLASAFTLHNVTQGPSMEHWDGKPPCHRLEENHLAAPTAPSCGASTLPTQGSLRSSASSTSLASTAASSLFEGDECAFSSRSSTPEPVDAALSTKPCFAKHSLPLVTGDYASRVRLSAALSTVRPFHPVPRRQEKSGALVIRPPQAPRVVALPLFRALGIYAHGRVVPTPPSPPFSSLFPFRRYV
ncbi:hypothetical protein JCM10213_000530 [Rhodosporidiobolus nylandii]